MIYITPCSNCKHGREELIDGWVPSCDAFPDGMPIDFPSIQSVMDMAECNNGIGYDPIQQDDPFLGSKHK